MVSLSDTVPIIEISIPSVWDKCGRYRRHRWLGQESLTEWSHSVITELVSSNLMIGKRRLFDIGVSVAIISTVPYQC